MYKGRVKCNGNVICVALFWITFVSGGWNLNHCFVNLLLNVKVKHASTEFNHFCQQPWKAQWFVCLPLRSWPFRLDHNTRRSTITSTWTKFSATNDCSNHTSTVFFMMVLVQLMPENLKVILQFNFSFINLFFSKHCKNEFDV